LSFRNKLGAQGIAKAPFCSVQSNMADESENIDIQKFILISY
jgi:hypothetical protein